MVRLDEALLRKHAEHNDGILPDLEEIALHQNEIEKIENLGSLCRLLKYSLVTKTNRLITNFNQISNFLSILSIFIFVDSKYFISKYFIFIDFIYFYQY